MIRLRFGGWFACGLMVAALAGCGDQHARILTPVRQADVAGAPAAHLQPAANALRRGLVPPTVHITCPVPSPLAHVTPPALRILWEGTDPDGVFTNEPVQYRYILLGPGSEFPPALAISDPDSLRRYYLLREWEGWTSVSAETKSLQLLNLVPGVEYVFAVIAFDESGLYSPLFSLSQNLLRFEVSFTGYAGPPLTVFGPGFQREFVGYFPATHVDLEVAAGQSVAFHWLAEAGGTCDGIDVRSYRWVLDPDDLTDETPRTDEATDLKHWSAPSLATTSATVGPFAAGPDAHHFFVEVTDIVGVKSLGAVQITAVTSSNRPPDLSGAVASLAGGVSPDKSMAPVSISGVTDPDGDPVTITVTGVTQDELVDDVGDGQTCPDAVIVGGEAQVRRERSGSGDGRVYTIWFTADDGRGGTSTGTADVCIPRGNGRERPCLKSDLLENSLGPCGDGKRAGGEVGAELPGVDPALRHR